jgi:hypothetical protein
VSLMKRPFLFSQLKACGPALMGPREVRKGGDGARQFAMADVDENRKRHNLAPCGASTAGR